MKPPPLALHPGVAPRAGLLCSGLALHPDELPRAPPSAHPGPDSSAPSRGDRLLLALASSEPLPLGSLSASFLSSRWMPTGKGLRGSIVSIVLFFLHFFGQGFSVFDLFEAGSWVPCAVCEVLNRS
jgi:hypothetical protein